MLDTLNRSLLRGTEKIVLRPKTYVVLSYLVQHSHRLVSKEEIMTAAWPEASVVDAALRVSIQEIRKALNDNADLPKFIETVGKEGYRFIAPVGLEISSTYTGGSVLPFVGRATELERLADNLDLAQAGKRQVVFITGEPGIGKTTLTDVFTNHLFENDEILVARGQCIEQYGAGEAYLPILDALSQLYRAVDGQQTISPLRQLAPSWLLNLSAVMCPEEREALARQCLGITAERRLREITTYLEEIARNHTIVLILEDLHWVDPSTLSLISFLARRRDAARLMLIGTLSERRSRAAQSAIKNRCRGAHAPPSLHVLTTAVTQPRSGGGVSDRTI